MYGIGFNEITLFCYCVSAGLDIEGAIGLQIIARFGSLIAVKAECNFGIIGIPGW
jgi:hypothetical protein